MTLLIYYIVLVTMLNAAIIAFCLMIEPILPNLSMPIFLCMFFASLWLAWIVSVHVSKPKQAAAPAE